MYRSGAGFCSEGRRITWLSGAARSPVLVIRSAVFQKKQRLKHEISVQLLALKSSSAVTVFCASGAAAETADMSGLSAGMRTSGSGHGWPMRHAASKYQGFKEYGPESVKLGLFLLLQNMHFRHPWRSGIKPRRQGDKFPWEATGLDVKKCCFCQLWCGLKTVGQ